jgi:hypothetical protein
LINIYAPNIPKERKEFFNEIYRLCACARPLILGGDFNCVTNAKLDKRGGNATRGHEGSEELREICSQFKLVDCFRSKFPDKKEYTYRGGEVSTRLDRFYISSSLTPSLQDVRHILYPFSDHSAVLINLNSFSHILFGKSYWKFNNSLLKDEDFIDYMTVILKVIFDSIPNEGILKWWDWVKEQIKERIRIFSVNKVKRENYYVNQIKKDYIKCEKKGDFKGAQLLKEEFYNLELEKLKGSMFRSKLQEFENGEKPTKFFVRSESTRAQKRCIQHVVNLQGEDCKSSDSILLAFREFYSNLFREEHVEDDVINDLLSDVPCMDEDDCESLGCDVSEEDVIKAVKGMTSDSSPGSDGLTKEFYCAFLKLFTPVLVRVFDEAFVEGILPDSQRLSYISLLCKDESNSHLLKNYRPISLLNVDYKILTKVLCNRLKLVLEQVVHIDQSCAVPGRSILNSASLLRDIIDFCDNRGVNGILLSLDQEKAFDRVSHHYLFSVLRAFGFGERFIRWVKLAYTSVSSSVIVNSFVSSPFSVTRSVRQGCSLSPLLYILCLEPILIKIRNDKQIKGILLPGNAGDQKVIAFADDSNFTIKDDVSAERVLDWYRYFGRGSGAKLNMGKSKGMFLGKWKTRSDHPFGISWVDKLKIFGAWFGKVNVEEMWGPILVKVRKTLGLFKGRSLSIFGRATIVNTMVLSKLWYLASILFVPELLIRTIEREVCKFIWGAKWDPLKRSTLYLPRAQGGIGLVNIKIKVMSLQFNMVSKLIFDRENVPFYAFGHMWLGLHLRKFKEYSFSNLYPHCFENVPTFYALLISNIQNVLKLDPSFSFTDGRSALYYYKCFLDKTKEMPKVCLRNPDVDFVDVFKNLSKIDRKIVNISFKLIHDVVPTKDFIAKRGMVVNRLCSFCRLADETTEHLFWHCCFVNKCKKFLGMILEDVLEVGLCYESVRFSLFPDSVSPGPTKDVIITIFAEFRYSVWFCRNRSVFDHRSFTDLSILNYFMSRLRTRIHFDFKRLNAWDFECMWCSEFLCSVDNDMQLVIHF